MKASRDHQELIQQRNRELLTNLESLQWKNPISNISYSELSALQNSLMRNNLFPFSAIPQTLNGIPPIPSQYLQQKIYSTHLTQIRASPHVFQAGYSSPSAQQYAHHLNHIFQRQAFERELTKINFSASPSFNKNIHYSSSDSYPEEDIIQKRVKIEVSEFSSPSSLKVEVKQENDTLSPGHQIKQEDLLPQEEETPIKQARSPPKNRWKNIPGHIMLAIKRGCNACRETPKGILIDSIKQFWDSLSDESRVKFSKFIQKYDRSWKTWTTIVQFISQEGDEETINILLRFISDLLSSKHKESLEKWLSQTKISNQTKDFIKLGRKTFKEEFRERITQAKKLSLSS